MNLLVTGGVGYIGSHFCLEALKAGHKLLVIDNQLSKQTAIIDILQQGASPPDTIQFFELDLKDKQALQAFFKAQSKIEAVVHFAALKNAPASVLEPLSYYHNNVVGSVNLIDCMHKAHIDSLVFSSTAAVYAPDAEQPCAENSDIKPVTPYGKSKRMIEIMLEDIAHANPAFRAVSLRYFNAAGLDDEGVLKSHLMNDNDACLFSAIAKVLHQKEPFLSIYGTDYATHDSTALRDYIHVLDLVDAHLKALSFIAQNKGAYVFNLGQGKAHSVLEIVKAFEKNHGITIPCENKARRLGDLEAVYANPTYANEVLGWQALRDINRMVADIATS